METTEERPNIRIEIHNNLVDSMDIDELNDTMEDGEISDANEDIKIVSQKNYQISKRVSRFT